VIGDGIGAVGLRVTGTQVVGIGRARAWSYCLELAPGPGGC
jgi:hypothetical protein